MSGPVTIIVEGSPVGKGRPRFGKGRTYTPEKTRCYERSVAIVARIEMGSRKPMTGPLQMKFRAVFAIPQSWSKLKQNDALVGRIRPTVKPDIDNILKGIADALNGIAYVDDSQIVETTCSKRYGLQPLIVATILPIDGALPENTAEQEKGL